ncbi:MAG: hypothetical protein ABIG11_08570 [bacterium]
MRRVACSLISVIAALPACAKAELLMYTARQSSEKSLALTSFYQETVDQKFLFRVSGPGIAQGKGGLVYASDGETDVKGEQRRGTFFVKLTGQPFENLQYYGAAGIGSSSVKIPSATVTNAFYGDNPGMTWQAGVRACIFPETELTPALSADLGFGWSRFHFNRMAQNSAGSSGVNVRFDTLEYHLAFQAGRRFGKWESYAGVNMVRRQAVLKDLDAGERAGGINDYVAIFAGTKLPLFSRESLVAEMSFVDGFRFGLGLEIKLR